MTEKSFDFGQNWQRFLNEYFSKERVSVAEDSLKMLLELESLSGMTFLDIGCGSGMFSLTAYKLDADHVLSFDVNEQSVSCCRQLHSKEGSPQNWEIRTGSTLDQQFLSTIAPVDIVYSWGVLHHTGNMWQAIHNAAKLVKPKGKFVIGIYNYRGGRQGTETWKRLKRWYCNAPRWQAALWEKIYTSSNFAYMALVGRNPIRHIREYKRNRGMSWFRDVTDWLGGYPYEAATPGEILEYMKKHFGFILVKQNINCDLGVSEFVFEARMA